MTNLIKIPTLFFTLCCLFLAPPTEAQQAGPQSRWVVGAHVGFPLILDQGSYLDEETDAFFVDGLVHFRLFRRLGFTANLVHSRQQSNCSISVRPSALRPTILINRDIFIYYTHLTVGPKFNFRLGQGDLGLGIRFGAFLRQPHVRAVSTNNRAYNVKYRYEQTSATALSLDYTYWPQAKFGFFSGLEIMTEGNLAVGRVSSGEAVNAPLETVYSDTDLNVLDALGPNLTSTNWVNLKFGLVYRLN